MDLGGIIKEENTERKEGQGECIKECSYLEVRKHKRHEPRDRINTIRDVRQTALRMLREE